MGRSEYGARIAQMGWSRSQQIVWYFLAALFAGAGAALFYLNASVESGAMTSTASPGFDVEMGELAIAVAAAIVLVVIFATVTTQRIAIHEHGVIVRRRGRQQGILFRDMRDVYRGYPLGPIAFRTDENEPWVTISPRTSRFGRIVSAVLDGQLAGRGPWLLDELTAGRTVSFWVLESGAERAASWAFGRKQSSRIGKPRLALNAHGIYVDERYYPIDKTTAIHERLLRESWALSDGQGTIFSAYPSAILSRDLFTAALNYVQSAKLAGQ